MYDWCWSDYRERKDGTVMLNCDRFLSVRLGKSPPQMSSHAQFCPGNLESDVILSHLNYECKQNLAVTFAVISISHCTKNDASVHLLTTLFLLKHNFYIWCVQMKNYIHVKRYIELLFFFVKVTLKLAISLLLLIFAYLKDNMTTEETRKNLWFIDSFCKCP